VKRVADFSPEQNERDSWEGGFWDASDPRDIDVEIELTYTDAEGSTTTRAVRTRSFDNKLYGGTLIGHCHLRNATRTFRFDRVRRAVHIATGEVIGDLRAHLNQLYANSPQRARDTLQEEYEDVLRVLLFVAKANGQFREAEKQVVRAHLRELARDPRMTDEMADRIFQELSVPSPQAFKLAVGRIVAQHLVDPARLHEVCQQIVATQKIVSPGEQEALAYIAKRASLDLEGAKKKAGL
jgi:NTP pyrophosphatase (non-canonical NTP hydrolase)